MAIKVVGSERAFQWFVTPCFTTKTAPPTERSRRFHKRGDHRLGIRHPQSLRACFWGFTGISHPIEQLSIGKHDQVGLAHPGEGSMQGRWQRTLGSRHHLFPASHLHTLSQLRLLGEEVMWLPSATRHTGAAFSVAVHSACHSAAWRGR